MHSLGYILTDMRKWEIEGNPENRQNRFTPMNKWGREKLGHYRLVAPAAKRTAGGNDTNFRNVRPKAQAGTQTEGTRAGWIV